MDLILWRHAEAEDGLLDMERALTEKGQQQAEVMAKWLARRLPKGARILASPALRAQQTVQALKLPYETERGVAPGASASAFLAAVDWEKGEGVVLVAGHQPTLGDVAAKLLFGVERDFSLKKGAVVWLSRRQRGMDGQVVLRAAMTPELA